MAIYLESAPKRLWPTILSGVNLLEPWPTSSRDLALLTHHDFSLYLRSLKYPEKRRQVLARYDIPSWISSRFWKKKKNSFTQAFPNIISFVPSSPSQSSNFYWSCTKQIHHVAPRGAFVSFPVASGRRRRWKRCRQRGTDCCPRGGCVLSSVQQIPIWKLVQGGAA